MKEYDLYGILDRIGEAVTSLFQDSTLAFAWRDWGKPHEIVWIHGAPTTIQIQHLPNTNQKHYHILKQVIPYV
jgi:hypothetical protein